MHCPFCRHPVAYLRFASVYRGFESLADFEDEIATLRHGRPGPQGRNEAAQQEPSRPTAMPGRPSGDPDRSRKGDTT